MGAQIRVVTDHLGALKTGAAFLLPKAISVLWNRQNRPSLLVSRSADGFQIVNQGLKKQVLEGILLFVDLPPQVRVDAGEQAHPLLEVRIVKGHAPEAKSRLDRFVVSCNKLCPGERASVLVSEPVAIKITLASPLGFLHARRFVGAFGELVLVMLIVLVLGLASLGTITFLVDFVKSPPTNPQAQQDANGEFIDNLVSAAAITLLGVAFLWALPEKLLHRTSIKLQPLEAPPQPAPHRD